jgi:hypothetical protein
MGSFKNYREKKKRNDSKAELTDSERTYIDKIVAIADQHMTVNNDLDIEAVIETAYRQVLDEEMVNIDKQLKNAVLYATDKVKEKYPPKLNTNINDGDPKDDNSRNVERTTK